MAANLISIVMQFLPPEAIGQIASFLGLDRSATQKAAEGAVPTLLAGLSDLVSTPSGTNQLSRLLAQQPAGPVTDLLRNAGAPGLAETGSSMLSALFGGRTMDAMSDAVGRFAGMGGIGGKSLLGVLSPIVLGALGQQQRTAGLDADGLASLLRSQKSQIIAAIPTGLASQLGAAGLIDRADTGLRSGMAAASAGASRIEDAAQRAGARVSQVASTTANTAAQWPYWLAAAIVLGGLAWYTFGRQGEETVAELPAKTQSATVGMAPAELTVDGVNLADKFSSSMSTLRSALPGITDAASAQTALPKINEVIAQLNDISTRTAKLSPEGRSAFVKQIDAARPLIDQMCDKVETTPDIGAVAKLAIGDLRGKLDALGRV